MFGATSRLRLVTVLLMGVLAVVMLAVASRGKKEIVNPYVHDSLRRVTRGDTLSANFLFDIDAPKFEYVRGNTGLIRDGNLLELLVADGLEQNYQRLTGALLGVRKAFSPPPTHLVLQRIKRNGVVEADSLKAPAHYTLPRLLRANQVNLQAPGAALPEIGWDDAGVNEARASFLPTKEGESLKMIKSAFLNFVYAPRHDLTAEARANPSPKDYAWYLIGDKSSLEVVDLTEGGEWMLNLLKAKDLPVIGAFTLTSLETDGALRRVNHPGLGHVVGRTRINWFEYATTYVEACAIK